MNDINSKHVSGEYKLGELTASLSAMAASMASMSRTTDDLNGKLDRVMAELAIGNGKFKDLEHADVIMDLRVKAIETASQQSSATKQSIAMLLLDKGVGVLLPWGAIAYMLYGKGAGQ